MPLTTVYKELFALDHLVLFDGKEYQNVIGHHSKDRTIEKHKQDDLFVSALQFDRVEIVRDKAHLYLIGDYVTIGSGEPPIMKKILESAATQFEAVNSVKIYLNEKEMNFIHGGI